MDTASPYEFDLDVFEEHFEEYQKGNDKTRSSSATQHQHTAKAVDLVRILILHCLTDIQGNTSGCAKPPIDIDLKVMF